MVMRKSDYQKRNMYWPKEDVEKLKHVCFFFGNNWLEICKDALP